jgi:thiol-disulfide isomerase/thioredoxin
LPELEAAFWALRLPKPDGTELVMVDLRGQPLIVNFWATWCPPCVRELPRLDAFWRQHRASGWQVLGWAIDNTDPVRQFLQRAPVGFPVALAAVAGLEWTRRLGNDSGGLPFTVLFGSQGLKVKQHAGEITDADLTAWRADVEGRG